MLKQPFAAILALGAVLALSALPAAGESTAPRKTLAAFASEQELANLFRKWQDEHQRRMEEERRRREEARARMQGQLGDLQAPPAPAAKAAAPTLTQSLAGAAAESITNVQHAGVDEGGIVKLHGDHLVILRRGRLFTVGIRNRELKPVSVIDAFGDGIEPRGAWYDEMLISGDTIAIIGYSYARGGTEVGLFEISSSGQLSYKATYHLRSNDYYSSRNYASRLIGSKLIFYSPLFINLWRGNPMASLPAMRRWHRDAKPEDFKRIAPATRIYRTDEDLDPYQGVALHTVSICDLAQPELECESTTVLGLPGRVFYVSANSVFVWTTARRRTGQASTPSSAVFRIPLDGSAPSALKTAGSPIDPFSFLEGEDGFLNVL
ncbi:MAG: beta-propeller domain-containing protein, partial [Betaproteobacteria bacterium]|nr:beta-propeller domain-containing protein [Betaproteobacteria bacterium]